MPRRLFGLVLVVGLASTDLAATVVVPTEFKEIVADATLIARGHVTDVRGVVVPNRGIESVVAVAIDSVLKGSAAEFITIRVPGGTVGRYTTRMIGAPRLRPGQRAIFFLKRDNNLAWRPVGLSMGIFHVRDAPLTGAPVVNPPVILGETADPGRVIRGDRRREPLPVASFESLVRLVLAAQAGASRQGGR